MSDVAVSEHCSAICQDVLLLLEQWPLLFLPSYAVLCCAVKNLLHKGIPVPSLLHLLDTAVSERLYACFQRLYACCIASCFVGVL